MANKRDFVIGYGLRADKSVGATDTLTVDYINDKVGIGTSSPSERLHVSGNALVTGDLTVNGTINFSTSQISSIVQGNSSVSVADTGSNGTITLTTEGVSRLTVSSAGTVTMGGGMNLGAELNFTTASNKYIDFYTDNDSGVLSTAYLRLVNTASTTFHNAITMARGGAVTLYHNNASKLATTSTGVDITGDLTVSGGDITAGNVAASLFAGNTTTNITIGSGLTTGTFTAGATGSTGAVSLFPATGAQNITLGGATTGTVTIGSTSATAVQLPTGKTKIGQTTLVQGGAVSITLPTLTGTLAITTETLSSSTTSTQSGYFGDIFLFDDFTPSHYLQVTNSANLTAARTLSVNVNDANRTVSLSGDLTVSATTTVSGTNTGDQTITLTGDVTGSGTGSFAATIAADAVTFAKMQNSAAAGMSVIGRSANSAGDFAEISAGTDGHVLRRSGTTLGFGTLTLENLPDAWVKRAVKAATTADLGTVTATATTLTGPTGASAVVFPAQDGITIALNDRILVKNQTTAAQNGIYTLTTVGVAATTAWVLTRAADADTSAELSGAVVSVDQGTTNGGELWTTNFKPIDTVGTTAMTWNEVIYNNFSSPTFSGTLTTGSTITAGNTPISIYPGNTTTNITIGSGLTTGTFTVGATGSTGAVSLFPATGGQSITLGGATTGTITIGSTSAAAVQLPTGRTKIGTSTLVQGSAFTYSLPTVTSSSTLAVSNVGLSQFASTTSAELAGVISDETGTGALVFGTSPAFTTSITTGSTSFDLINTTAATVNFAGGATALTIGATAGTTTIRTPITSLSGDLQVNGGDITTTSTVGTLFDTTATTVDAFGAATSLSIGHDGTSASTTNIATGALTTGTKTLNIGTGGVTSAVTNINLGPLDLAGTTTVGGNAVVRGRLQTSSNTSSASWTTTGISFDSAAATFTNTSGAGTYTPQVANSFNRPTFASTNAVTVTDAATVYINNSPASGTNTTITDAWSLLVDAGRSRFDEGISLGVISAIRGPIISGTISNNGSGYTDGTYTLVPLTGGRGSYAYATITVAGGIVTGVTITREGRYYQASDVLSATSASPFSTTGSGFTWTVSTVRTVDLQIYNNPARIRLGSSSSSVSAGTELGSILFGCGDTSAGGSGDKVRLIAAAEGTSGGGQLQIWTSADAGEPTLGFAFGGSNDFRLYNTAGTFYHTFSNAPTANRTITIPDYAFTIASQNVAETFSAAKTFSDQIISTDAWNAANGGGQIYLNGATGNRIDFVNTGVAAPAFTTRSVGTKIVLYPTSSPATQVDYAFGIESSTLWSSVPTTSNQFKWYGGTTNIATLSGTGNLTIGGAVSGASATPSYLFLGNNFSNGTTRDKCKIFLYNTGTEQYGFGVGSTSDVQYHSNGTHDFYVGNTKYFTVSSSNLTFNSNTVWHAGNHGSGSGLDADTLDGIDSGSFLRSDADDTTTGNLTISKTSPKLILNDTNSTTGSYPAIQFDTTNNQGVLLEHNEFDAELPIGGYGLILKQSPNNAQFPTGTISFSVLGNIYAGGTTIGTVSRVLTTADEGAGNGLDADLLDGKNTGTSGNTIPLLDGTNTWSNAQTFSSRAIFSDGLRIGPTPGDPNAFIVTRTIPAGDPNVATEATELLLFHSNDPANNSGPDFITLRSPSIRFQTYNNSSVVDPDNSAGWNNRLTIDPTGIVNVLGTLQISDQIISTDAWNAANGGGQIYLNGATGNRIDFNTNGVGAPAFTTRSAGTKLVLYPNIGVSAVDYAFGIESNTLWSSVATTSNQFKWYGGTTNVATLSGTGNLTITGDVAVNGGDVTTTATTASIFDATATTVNAFRAATTLNLATSGTNPNINIATTDSTGTTTIGNNMNVRGRLQTSSNTSSASWTTTGISFDSAAATFTNTSGAGTYTPQVANSFRRPTFDSTNAVTVTDAATVYINNSPAATGNTTITDAWSLFVDAGYTRLDSGITIGGITPARGPILTGTISNAGTGYTDGTYTLVPLTGGRGGLAYATITVAGGIVTVVTITREGSYYQEGDVLSATSTVGGFGNGTGSGFTWTVSTVRSVDVQIYSPSPRIRLGSSLAAISSGVELGSILFNCQDSTAGGRGDKVRLVAVAEGTSGGGQLQIWTATNGGEPTLGFLFGGNNDFRLYNNAGDGYHKFVNNPSPAAVRSVNLPDADITFANAFTTSGAFPLTLTTTASTNVTLPTTGTLATLGGAETFSGVKTFTANPRLNDLIKLEVGTNADLSLYHDGSNNYIDTTLGNLIIRDGTTQRVLFERTTGSLALGGVTTPTAKLHLPAGVATASGAPLKINSGVVLATPEADALEYDGVLLYHTQNDATNGNKRAIIPEFQYIRRSTDVSITAVASPGTSMFGATLRPALVAGRVYEVEAVIFARKDTNAGTITIQASLSTGTFTFCSLQCNNAATSVAINQTASPTNIVTTASVAVAQQFGVTIRGLVVAASNARLDLLAYGSTTALTIHSSSFMKITCLGTGTSSGNFG